MDPVTLGPTAQRVSRFKKPDRSAPRPLIELCIALDAAEAAAWDRIGGPTSHDWAAIAAIEAEIGSRPADCPEVAEWRELRLFRARENGWVDGRVRMLAKLVRQDGRIRFKPEAGKPITNPQASLEPPSDGAGNSEIHKGKTPVPPAGEPPVHQKLAYTVREVIVMAGIGRSAIYEEMAAGRLKARKRGTRTIFLHEDLIDYLQALPSSGNS